MKDECFHRFLVMKSCTAKVPPRKKKKKEKKKKLGMWAEPSSNTSTKFI